ncbi:hypothetical protein [Nocardia thailandica]|uniref:TetR family transcriptional regulator n=1 Tax=Nocardia thailandica TaxID=257275 RepID=A0ABW6PTX9_9NOCA
MSFAGDRDVDPLVRSEVVRIHEEWLADPALPYAARLTRIDAHLADLTHRIGIAEVGLLDDLLVAWRRATGRNLPPVQVFARLRSLAHDDARRAVLCEHLYAQVPTGLIMDRRRTGYANAHRRYGTTPAPDLYRWRTRDIVPSPVAESIVLRTWGMVRSLDFLVLAAALIEVRLQDGMPIPETPLDPLATTLAAMVHDQLVVEGLPPV